MDDNQLVVTPEKIADIALRSSGLAADSAVMAYASQSGDEKAIALMSAVEPAILARIVREHDVSKPSFIGLLSRPEDVVSIFSADPASRGSSQKEIQKAYRRLARIFHPDVYREAGGASNFRQIQGAYEVLSDPIKRQEYDGESSVRYIKDPKEFVRSLWSEIF